MKKVTNEYNLEKKNENPIEENPEKKEEDFSNSEKSGKIASNLSEDKTDLLTHDRVKKEQVIVFVINMQIAIFEKYLEDSGINLGFEIIFREILAKKIPEDQVFAYAALRLKQLEEELNNLTTDKAAAK